MDFTTTSRKRVWRLVDKTFHCETRSVRSGSRTAPCVVCPVHCRDLCVANHLTRMADSVVVRWQKSARSRARLSRQMDQWRGSVRISRSCR